MYLIQKSGQKDNRGPVDSSCHKISEKILRKTRSLDVHKKMLESQPKDARTNLSESNSNVDFEVWCSPAVLPPILTKTKPNQIKPRPTCQNPTSTLTLKFEGHLQSGHPFRGSAPVVVVGFLLNFQSFLLRPLRCCCSPERSGEKIE